MAAVYGAMHEPGRFDFVPHRRQPQGAAMHDNRDYPDTALEEHYWRDNFRSRPYVDAGASYDDFGPAYNYGVDSYGRYKGQRFEDVESDLSSGWEKFKGKSKLTWEHAKNAVRDAWNRMTD
jgi:hypothetical protein